MGLRLPGSNCEVSDDFIGGILQYNGGTQNWNGYALGWRRYPDYSAPYTNWGENVASTASNVGVTSINRDYTANGVSSLSLSNAYGIVGGRCANFRGIWYVKIESLSGASGSSTAWSFKVGLGDDAFFTASPGNPTDGIFFETTFNNALWYATCVSSSGSVGNVKTSTTIVPSTGWVKLELRSNEAGTSWYFYVNDVLKVTQTTFIPASGIFLNPGFKLETGASISSGTPKLNIDYFYMNIPNLAR